MDQELAKPDDLSARRDAMRERLRLRAERVLEAVEEIGDPKSFLEVERAARAILVVDRMIMQLFSPAQSKTLALIYDDGTRYEYGERGRGSSVRVPVEKVGDAPIVTSSPVGSAALRGTNDSQDRSLAHPPLIAGEDKKAESAHTDGVENSFKDEMAFSFDPEKEAHANAIFAAYCEFKRLERAAEERFGLGP